METEQKQAEPQNGHARQGEIAHGLVELAGRLRDLLVQWPSEAVWNRPARLLQLADDCKAEAEDFDDSVPQREEAIAAWDEVLTILQQGKK